MLKPVTKDAIKDPEMFWWVQKLVDDFVEELWPELEEEIIYILRFKYDEPPEYDPGRKRYCYEKCRCCYYMIEVPRRLRAWFIYTRHPVDKTIWGQMKTFSWWFLTLLSVIPVFGVSLTFFLLDFIC